MEAEALVEQLEQQQPRKSRKGRATKTPGKGFAPAAPETTAQKKNTPLGKGGAVAEGQSADDEATGMLGGK
jgi:hypothetical protein